MGAPAMPSVIGPAHFVPPVRAWWRNKLSITEEWPAEDICYGLAERFAEIVTEDPDAFAAVHGRSCVYLANHQVGVESYLFSILISGIGGVTLPVIAKAEHCDTWLGRIVSHSVAYPGIADPQLMVPVEREHPASVARAFEQLCLRMHAGEISVLAHVEGTRALSCRQPVARLSPALLDMALVAGAPVVPVRFARGLPAEPAAARLEFPAGYGRQQYWIGRPILPEELASLRYADRARAVLDKLNALGPGVGRETPAEPDPAFAQRVAQWMQQSGATHENAVIYAALAERTDPGPAIRRVLDGARLGRLEVGEDAASQWLGKLARMLYGPHGAQVAGLREIP